MVVQRGELSATATESSTRSVPPVQYVAHNRPARLALAGLLAQNPVAVKRIDGAVAPLQLDPSIDEMRPVLVAPGHRIGQRDFDNLRLRHDHCEFRVKQA